MDEVDSRVIAINGWDLRLAGMRCRMLLKDQGYEEIIESKLLALGLPFSPERDIVTLTVE